MKDIVKPIAVLAGICLVVTALLAYINMVTSPIITKAEEEAAAKARAEVLTEADDFEKLDAKLPEGVTEAYKAKNGAGYVFMLSTKGYGGEFIYMSPRGEMLSGALAEELSKADEITILCGHYEGVDQRALDMLGAREVSIGDYVLTGGELPAMVLVDTVARFVEGVLSKEESVMNESVYSGLLEYPHYSRPAEYKGMAVPEVLLSGDHGAVDLWRWEQSLALTKERRPDLFEKYLAEEHEFSKKEKAILEKYK